MTSQRNTDAPELIHAVPVKHWGRWISAAAVAVIAAMIAHGLVSNKQFHWDIVFENFFKPNVLNAVGWTLILTVAAMIIGITLAVTLAVMRRSENPVLRAVSMAYIWFFRGTPIYTQLIFWGLVGTLYPKLSLGIPFGPEFFTFDTNSLITASRAAILGLGLNEGAYLSEIVRSGLNSVDPGQEEAARALGMSPGQILRRVIIPQAMRVIVPPTGNETISMLKTTSLVTAVPFTLDLTAAMRRLGSNSFLPIPYLVIAALWYLIITSVLMAIQSRIEAYYGKGAKDAGGSGRRATGKARKKERISRQAALNAAHTTPDENAAEWTP